jgi:CRISPR-associated protein Cas1
MTTLYVDRKGVSLRADAGTLVFEEGGQRLGWVPLGPLERVVLRGDVSLQASALGALGQQGVGVVVLSGRKGTPTLLLHRPHHDARRRMAQWRAADDPARRSELALAWVTAKLEAQCAFLTERLPHEPMHRLQLRKAVDRLQHAMAALPIGAAPGQLRGHEGAAAAAYFSGLQPLFAPSLKFTGRNRRPPRDPVNAVLSLGYTLLHAEAVLQAHAAGLDPYVGFLHDLDYGRESLACDFVEPLRPVVDGLALRLFRERTLEAAHFSSVQGACLMGKAGRTRFYEAWEPVAEHLRKQLQGHAHALVRQLLPADALRPRPPPPDGVGEAWDSDAPEGPDPAPPGLEVPLPPTSDHGL